MFIGLSGAINTLVPNATIPLPHNRRVNTLPLGARILYLNLILYSRLLSSKPTGVADDAIDRLALS
jgi:hypothetical protein